MTTPSQNFGRAKRACTRNVRAASIFLIISSNPFQLCLVRSTAMMPADKFTAKRMYPRDQLEYRHGAMLLERSGGVVLAAVFAEDGELPARPAGTSRRSTEYRQPS